MTAELQFEEVTLVGLNAGYRFAVGRVKDRWLGFAIGELDGGERMLFIFPEIADGALLGLADKERAILLTGAIACDP